MGKNKCDCGKPAEALMPSIENQAFCRECLEKYMDNKKDKKTIAVDFDGVVHKYSKAYYDGTIYDEPIEGVRDALRLLRKKGFNVVIFTARNNLVEVWSWLEKHKIEVDDVTSMKPKAIAYINDRAIRFTNWRDMLNYF